jgi:branched-subunit amino acid ABC-type transport system permease component
MLQRRVLLVATGYIFFGSMVGLGRRLRATAEQLLQESAFGSESDGAGAGAYVLSCTAGTLAGVNLLWLR